MQRTRLHRAIHIAIASSALLVVGVLTGVGPLSATPSHPTPPVHPGLPPASVAGVTTELASGTIDVDPIQSVLATLDVSYFATIRVTVANSCFSPVGLHISIAHIENAGTEGANAIDALDRFDLVPCGNVSRSYAVPGTTVAITAAPKTQTAGATAFFTVFAR